MMVHARSGYESARYRVLPAGPSQRSCAGAPSLRTRPFAVEITLDLEDWGKIVRVVEVPT